MTTPDTHELDLDRIEQTVQVRNGDEWEIATSRLSFRRPS